MKLKKTFILDLMKDDSPKPIIPTDIKKLLKVDIQIRFEQHGLDWSKIDQTLYS